MPNGLKIKSGEEFLQLPVETQRLVLMENMLDLERLLLEIKDNQPQMCAEQQNVCNDRFKKIESRKWVSAVWSTVGGMIGGAAAVIGKMALFK